MPVPTTIKQLLDNQNISYHVNSSEAGDNDPLFGQRMRNLSAIKALVLKDDKGKVQALIPSDCLLDLDALNRQLGRNLKAIHPSELQPFFQRHNLDSVPALPIMNGITSIIDERVLERTEDILLDSGQRGHLLSLQITAFKQMLNGTISGKFTVPFNQLQESGEGSDDDQIFSAVKNFTSLRIKQRLEETLELPPLPDTARRIIQLRVDPNADISDLANIVESDPSLAAQVVSWASSPYYSAPGKIKSIHDAIVRVLGFDMVLNLALGLSLGKALNMPKDSRYGVTPYWQNAVFNAAAVEALVTAIPREHRPSFGMAYLSGLLHNFGYLILGEVFPPHFQKFCLYQEVNNHSPAAAIERHLLSITREQLASWLMALWNMPEEVVTALRYQQMPEQEGEYTEYAKVLFIAQRLLAQQGFGDGPAEEIPAEVYAALHLDPTQAEETIRNILASSDELNAIVQQLSAA